MFSKKRGGKSFIQIHIGHWMELFGDVKRELGNLWRKHCPMCICKHGKEKD